MHESNFMRLSKIVFTLTVKTSDEPDAKWRKKVILNSPEQSKLIDDITIYAPESGLEDALEMSINAPHAIREAIQSTLISYATVNNVWEENGTQVLSLINGMTTKAVDNAIEFLKEVMEIGYGTWTGKTNRQWLETLTDEEWYEEAGELFNPYAYTDVLEWLKQERIEEETK